MFIHPKRSRYQFHFTKTPLINFSFLNNFKKNAKLRTQLYERKLSKGWMEKEYYWLYFTTDIRCHNYVSHVLIKFVQGSDNSVDVHTSKINRFDM